MNKKTLGGMIAVFLVGILAIGVVSAFGGYGQKNGEGNENREAVKDALDAEDYDAWVTAINELERVPPWADVITEEDFDTIVKIHDAREEARAERQASRDEIKAALEDGDYETWKELVSELDKFPHDVETITEEDFNILVQIHEAKEEGDFETMKELREDLDFDFQGQGRMGKGNGFGKGLGQGRMRGGFQN